MKLFFFYMLFDYEIMCRVLSPGAHTIVCIVLRIGLQAVSLSVNEEGCSYKSKGGRKLRGYVKGENLETD